MSLFAFVVTKSLSFFSGSFQRPSASTTFTSIVWLTTYFRGGTEEFRANFIFSLVSSSLSKLSIPPDHSSFSTFFFSLVFCHFQLPARAQIKKTPETVGIAFGDFFCRARKFKVSFAARRGAPRPNRETRRRRPMGERQNTFDGLPLVDAFLPSRVLI